jgi:drug/metabolite transporter (DMT)-like permease
MACNPSDARAGGDVELVDVSLAEVTDGFGGVKGGKWERSPLGDAVSEDSESEDEGKGLLPRGDAGASASTSAPRRRDASSHVTGGLRGYITRVPKGEAVMLAATFTFAFQNVVAKRVERRVPPMEVVFVRSCISGAVTVFTTWRRVVECNAIVRKTNATDPDAPLDAPPAVPGEDLRDDTFTIETLLGSGRFWALCFLRGVAGSIAFSLAYISLTYLTVGDSVAIFFLNPIFSSLIAIPVLGEKPTLVQAVAIGGGLLGTLLIVKPPALFHALGVHTGDEATPLDPVGVIVTLFSAFFCAVAMVTIRKVKGRVSALVSFFHLFSHGQLE